MRKVITGVMVVFVGAAVFSFSWFSGFESGFTYQRKITQDATNKYNSLKVSYSKLNTICASYYSMFQDVAVLGLDYRQQTNYYLAEIKYIIAGDMLHANTMAGGINQLNVEIDGILKKYSDNQNKY